MLRRLKSIALTVGAVTIILLALLLASSFTKPSIATTPVSVARMWHGRVPAAKASAYTVYLNEAGIQKIRAIEGNLGVQMFKRMESDVAEFYVISYWKSRDVIRAFAGNDIEKASFLPRDRDYLINPELQVKHFDVLIDR